MNDKRFKELLNEYLDGALSGGDLQEFRQALAESPRYRNLLRQYQCLQRAQVVACRRSPRLNFGLFPFGRICRNGAMLMNATVLTLTVGLFQAREPLDVYFAVPTVSTEAALPGEVMQSAEKTSETAPLSVAKSAYPSTVAKAVLEAPAAVVEVKTTPVQIAEPVRSAPSWNDTPRSLLSDEYGFVIL